MGTEAHESFRQYKNLDEFSERHPNHLSMLRAAAARGDHGARCANSFDEVQGKNDQAQT